ncbi:MAG TPA: FkbM family methyltransferase [Candidatus Competibacteraceae bacterium]|nr:FkbM family methyltransferase [Candidatus Competibacteraceae bacterium]MCP5132134.1 FkbM family methyltransferase [Gammaproteobacteria bacterium]HPF58060.1 FkbM family methyltransferase [Candidatus Competibacteraceae bacterium]HRY16764.1 FkbM family methyltransferase [Candidatus Competibacteraceae bacterium]
MSAWTRFERGVGLLRSVLMYHGIPFRRRRLTRFYAQFIGPGDLCFDIGAHVGSRLRAWTPLGARIVAVEPQPDCMALLRRWFGHQAPVTLVEQAVGAVPGVAELRVSPRTPTVTTLSSSWIAAVRQDRGFAGVRWDAPVPVTVTTLDELIAHYGIPAFCKIDVEGYEREVLQGLSQPVPALSFEYLPACLDTARACVTLLTALGPYVFNWSVGETQCLRSADWLTAADLLEKLDIQARTGRSGDIYARLPRC